MLTTAVYETVTQPDGDDEPMPLDDSDASSLCDDEPTPLDDGDARAVELVDGDPLSESVASADRLCVLDRDADPLADAAAVAVDASVVGTADCDPVTHKLGDTDAVSDALGSPLGDDVPHKVALLDSLKRAEALNVAG